MLDLKEICERASGPSCGGSYHEAQARMDRDALVQEVERLRAMLGNLLEPPICDVCYEDDFVDHECSCGCHLMRADLEHQARALLGKE